MAPTETGTIAFATPRLFDRNRRASMAFRAATHDHDQRPRLDLGFLRRALPWMVGAWVVIGLVAWAVVAA
jgi:hypothetical protein